MRMILTYILFQSLRTTAETIQYELKISSEVFALYTFNNFSFFFLRILNAH